MPALARSASPSRAPAPREWKRPSRTSRRRARASLVVVTGYFGDRLAQIFERYGATVTRVDVEWGRACDPAAVERALAAAPADIVAIVHAETSTGVLNPVQEIAALAAKSGALTVVDAVTSLGAMPLETGAWGIDVVLQLLAEGARRAVRAGAAVVLGRARCRRRVPSPQLLSRSGAPRGLLGSPEVPPHDLGAARLRRARSAHHHRG